MKKIFRNALIISMSTLVFWACNKSDDSSSTSSGSKTDLLTAHLWKLTNIVADPPYDTLFTYKAEPCEADDRVSFSSNGNGTFDNGTLPCDTPETKVESFKWKWLNNETELQIIEGTDTTLLEQVTVTSTTLKGRQNAGFFYLTMTLSKP